MANITARHNIVYFVLTIMSIIGMIFMLSSSVHATETRVKFSQQYNNYGSDGKPVDTYFPHENRVYNVNFETSSNQSGNTNYTVRLDIDDEHIADFKNNVRVGKPQGAKEVRYEQEDGKYVIYVDFDNISGGAIFSFPVEFKMRHDSSYGSSSSSTIPVGYEHKVKASLLNDNGDVIEKANDLTFYTKYQEPRFYHAPTSDRIFMGFADDDGSIIKGTESDYARFTYSSNGDINTPQRAFDSYKITHYLLDGATFDPDLEVNGVKVNKDWELSSDGKSVSRIVDRMSVTSFPENLSDKNGHALYLTYKDKKNGDVGKSKAEVHFYLKDRQDYEPEHYLVKDEANFTFSTMPLGDTFSKRGYGKRNVSGIQDNIKEKREGFAWVINIDNPSETSKMTNLTFSDYKKADGSYALDEDKEFRFIYVLNNRKLIEKYIKEVRYHTLEDGETNIVVKTADDVERHPRINNGYAIIAPSNTVGVEIDLHDLAPQDSFSFYLQTAFKDPEGVSFDKTNSDNNIYRNEGTLDGEILTDSGNSSSFTVSDSDYVPLLEFKETIDFGRYVSRDSFMVGDRMTDIGVKTNLKLDPEKVFKDMSIIHIVPDGIELDEDKPVNTNAYAYVKDTRIEYDYKGTGLTAVIVDYHDITGDELLRLSLSSWIRGTVTNLSDEGKNYIDTYLTGPLLDDDSISIPSRYMVDDEYGFNSDSVKNPRIARVRNTYNYLPVKEVTVDKYTRTDYQNGWMSTGAYSDFDTEFKHRLEVVNYLDSNIKDLIIYDVFPHKGDKNIVADGEGHHKDRNSLFRNHLTGAIEVPKGFTVYYTTNTPESDPSKSVNADYWSTSVSDYADVTAIKVVMDSDKELSSKERVSIVIPMKTPKQAKGLSYGDRAYNSFAVSTSKGNTFTEANPSYVELHKRIDIPVQKVWDGEPQKSVDVDLYANGELVDSKTITAEDKWKTVFTDLVYHDEDGKEINYTVREKPIEGYVSTITGDAGEGFTITNSDSLSIDVRKIWAGDKQNSIKVELLANNKKIDEQTIRASDGWKHTFTDLPRTDANGKEIKYDVREVEMTEYKDEIIGNMYDGFIITNTQKVVLNFDKIQIYTDKYENGLPLKLDISALQGTSSIFENVTGDEEFSIIIEEMKRDSTGNLIESSARKIIERKNIKLDDIADTLEFTIPASELNSEDDVKAYRAKIVSPDDIFILGIHSEIDADGHTASMKNINAHTNIDVIDETGIVGEDIDKSVYNQEDSRIDYHDDGFVYKDVIMTERIAGESTINEPYPNEYKEQLTMLFDMDDDSKSGYGVTIAGNMSYAIYNPLGSLMSNEDVSSLFGDLEGVSSTNMSLIYNNALSDSINHNIYEAPYDNNRKHTHMEQTDEVFDMSDSYVSRQYELPEIMMDNNGVVYNKDNQNIQHLLDAGRKLYVPIWIDELGHYHVTMGSDTESRIGIHHISFNMTKALDIYAYMFSHIDSDTTDKDEIMIHQKRGE